MKKTLLFFALCAITISGFGQCTPDPIYASENFGFWPAQDLPYGVVDVPYSQVIDIKAPANGGELDPAWSAYTIDSISIANIVGLPSGYDYACNSATCAIPGGEQACLLISGTESVAGDYPLVINLSIYTTVSGISLNLPYTYNDYILTVQLTDGVDELTADNIILGQNIPNPMQDQAVIPFTLKEDGLVTFAIFNVVGETIYEETFRGVPGINEYTFNADDRFSNGVYLYNLSMNGISQTKRMLIKK